MNTYMESSFSNICGDYEIVQIDEDSNDREPLAGNSYSTIAMGPTNGVEMQGRGRGGGIGKARDGKLKKISQGTSNPEESPDSQRQVDIKKYMLERLSLLEGTIGDFQRKLASMEQSTMKVVDQPKEVSKSISDQDTINTPRTDIIGQAIGRLDFTAPWAEIIYYEDSKRIGNKFLCEKSYARIDSSRSKKIERTAGTFNIGYFRNAERSVRTKLIRDRIDRGIILQYVHGEVSISNFSKSVLYVLTNYFFIDGVWKINKTKQRVTIQPDGTARIFKNPHDKEDHYQDKAFKGKLTLDEIRKSYRIYISFECGLTEENGLLTHPCWFFINMRIPENLKIHPSALVSIPQT